MASEREMILKAQLDAENLDPLFQIQDLNTADEKRQELEEKIRTLNREWFGKIEKVK